MKSTSAIFLILSTIWSSSFAAAQSVEVIDGGKHDAAKIEKIQILPMGKTQITIQRDELQRISHITIDQNAEISTSGNALELTDLLADLVDGDSLVEIPVVQVNQTFTLAGDLNATGIRFAGKSNRNAELLNGISLNVIQNIPLIDKGQTWTSQKYATAYVHDFPGLQEFALGLASGTPSGRSLADVASFPGADRIYKKITIGGNIGVLKGTVNHIGIETASLVPAFRPRTCASNLAEDSKNSEP